MDRFPQIKNKLKRAVKVPVPPLFQDHHVGGRPLLPAVEAMELMVDAMVDEDPFGLPICLTDIGFGKFYYPGTSDHHISGFLNLDPLDKDRIRGTFTTQQRFGPSGIKRTLEHASLTLSTACDPVSLPPVDLLSSVSGICHTVLPETIYEALVPFGPAYCNISAPLKISPDGALAMVSSPLKKDGRKALRLGSPYPLDAAFHAACVWSQFYKDVVAFPVAVGKRMILKKAPMDRTCVARMIPVQTEKPPFVFDLYIFDEKGAAIEAVTGIHMQDISGGRTRPPQWIRCREKDPDLQVLKDHCKALAVVEKSAMAPFAGMALSDMENKRASAMTEKRLIGYTAARLAVKRISRSLSGKDRLTAAHAIETVKGKGPEPVCPVGPDAAPVCCSVSHNRRFAIAVAHDTPIGVDVETISEKPLNNRHLFMTPSEQTLVENLSSGRRTAATKIWSAKEAVAKAKGISLDRAWQRARVVDIKTNTSRVLLDDQATGRLIHERIEDNLFTLFVV